jgi:hypothetical protein
MVISRRPSDQGCCSAIRGTRQRVESDGCHKSSPPQDRQDDREETISAVSSAFVEDVEKAGGVKVGVKSERWRALLQFAPDPETSARRTGASAGGTNRRCNPL